jgi:hypothetical protein
MTWPFDKLRRRRRLADLLAGAASEFLANGLDHLPLPRHHLQRLGDGLTELGEPAAAARTRHRTGDYHALARQRRRKGRPYRLLAGEGAHRRVLAWRGGFVLGRARCRLLELQFQLVEQFAAALGGLAVLLPLKTYRSPACGSRPNTSWTCTARLFMPRRMSVWPTANHTRTPDGTGIIAATAP